MSLTTHGTSIALLLILALQALLQIPLDVRQRVLSRQVTLVSFLTSLIAVSLSAVINRDWTQIARPLVASSTIVAIYYVIHTVSPKSLGFGDVLLVAPITLAVAYLDMRQVFHWQLIATTFGTLHGTVLRFRNLSPILPFGPHLLVAAIITMTIEMSFRE